MFERATTVRIGNGQQAGFWTSSWLDGTPLRSSFPDLFKHSRRKNRMVAAALTNEQWISDLRHGNTTSIITEYLRLWRRLQLSGITLDNQVADQIAWTVGGGTYYSARAAYKHKPQQGRLEMLGVRDCQDVRVAASQEQAFVQ